MGAGATGHGWDLSRDFSFPVEKPPDALLAGEQTWNQLSGQQFGKIFLKVLKIFLLFDPVIPLLGIRLKEVIKQTCRNVRTGSRHNIYIREKKKKVKPT